MLNEMYDMKKDLESDQIVKGMAAIKAKMEIKKLASQKVQRGKKLVELGKSLKSYEKTFEKIKDSKADRIKKEAKNVLKNDFNVIFYCKIKSGGDLSELEKAIRPTFLKELDLLEKICNSNNPLDKDLLNEVNSVKIEIGSLLTKYNKHTKEFEINGKTCKDDNEKIHCGLCQCLYAIDCVLDSYIEFKRALKGIIELGVIVRNEIFEHKKKIKELEENIEKLNKDAVISKQFFEKIEKIDRAFCKKEWKNIFDAYYEKEDEYVNFLKFCVNKKEIDENEINKAIEDYEKLMEFLNVSISNLESEIGDDGDISPGKVAEQLRNSLEKANNDMKELLSLKSGVEGEKM